MSISGKKQKIEERFNFIDTWLPTRYTKSVNSVLEKKSNPAYIRQVKRERINNEKIMNALYLVARYNKRLLEK